MFVEKDPSQASPDRDDNEKMDKQSDLYNFLRTILIGFGVVGIGIVVAVIGYALATRSQ